MENTTIFCRTASSNSVTEEYWTLEDNFIVHGQVTAAFVLFYIVLGLPWNILVVITIVRKKLYHQPTIMLLLNLVLADLLMLLFPLPIIAVTGIAGEYIVGSTDMMRCQTCSIGLISPILMLDSLFVIVLMSVDRFLFIYKPLQYERKATKLSTLVAIGVMFILSLVIGLFLVFPLGSLSFERVYLSCIVQISRNNLKWQSILLIIAVCVSLIVIMVCNIWTIYIVQDNIKKVYEVTKSLANEDQRKSHNQGLSKEIKKKRHQKQLHLFRVFGGLLLSNIIAWFPKILVVIAYLIVGISAVPLSISSLAHILFLSQVAVHPIVETTLISDVREPLKDMVTCGLLKKKKDDFATQDEQTCSYFVCCRRTQKHSSHRKLSCSYLLQLINVAVLLHDHINSSISNTHASNKNGQEKEVESELAHEENTL